MASDFSVVAILAAFNEADVIGPVVGDLIAQGLQVYFLDDGSTDGTVAAVEPYVGRGVIRIEPLKPEPSDRFDWERILRRKAELARELDADWFIHHDADEFRESPWPQLSLSDAIRAVDALGFSAIDFVSLDFWPVHDDFRAGDDVRTAFPFYAEAAACDRLQIRAWKKTAAQVDLASSGGHEAAFAGREVFPLRFISRHYPIRGQAHGSRKVFQERRNRLRPEERRRGWHVQYDAVREDTPFVRDRSTLTRYDADAIRVSLPLRHRGVEALEGSLSEARMIAETRRLELAAQYAALETQGQQLDTQRQQLEAQCAAIEGQRLEIDRRRLEQEALTRELAVAVDALARARADFAAKSGEAETLRDAVRRQEQHIESLARAVRDSARQLVEFEQSLSWRVTSPARAAYRAIKGR